MRQEKYVSALTDISYEGYNCIEMEDKAFALKMRYLDVSLLETQKCLKDVGSQSAVFGALQGM